ncbi:hypothetical protein [Psychroserpens sp. SPM9]|uniref:hypothetical protein n=1 Tax=Psychroserpens sp. SPM9 TaxID=2975598 RepID=UPI0021A82F33|nr:hypothetical protein [Psychroserpens sp. SPM9]MDG5492310.1 hypothetical protein [Psychroserpens sp. SPM9]
MTEIINQVFALDLKMKKDNNASANRYLDRIYHEFETMGFQIVNPIGQAYRNEMTDVEANVVGDLSRKSKITKVLKPVIYQIENNETKLLQKGIVIVE